MRVSMVKMAVIARAAHGLNRAFCESIGDHSQPTWEAAPQWQRDSAIEGVRFHLDASHMPAESHENWLKQKEAEGWVYGKVKDPDKKEHPCMVPYNDLPVEQQSKDYIFRSCVHEAARLIGLKPPVTVFPEQEQSEDPPPQESVEETE